MPSPPKQEEEEQDELTIDGGSTNAWQWADSDAEVPDEELPTPPRIPQRLRLSVILLGDDGKIDKELAGYRPPAPKLDEVADLLWDLEVADEDLDLDSMPQTTVLPAAKRNHDDSLGRCRRMQDPKLPAVSHAQKPYRSFESPRLIVDKVATLVDKISQRISSDTDGTILPTPRSPPVMGRLSRAIEVGTKFKDVTIPALRSTTREEANMSRGLTTPWRAEEVQPGSKAAAAESLQIDEVPCIYSFLRKQFADVNLHNRRAVTESDLISFVRSRARHMGHVPADFEDLLRESGRRCFQQAAVRKEGIRSEDWVHFGLLLVSSPSAPTQLLNRRLRRELVAPTLFTEVQGLCCAAIGPEVMSVTCAVAILQLSVDLFHRTEPSARLRMSGELLFRACSWAWVLPTLRAAEPGSAGDCFNPLFQPHWAGKSDIRHLASRPTVQNSLNLCPIWNLRPACCTVSFEDEQKQAFQRWETHWKNKASHLELLRSQMEDFGVTQEYRDASSTQRVLFDAALDSMRYVVATYGICFDTLLEYAAGMLCFSCQPHWHHQLLLDDSNSRVLLLRIEESSNNELWDSCSPLSYAAKELDHRIQDSMLAKRLTSSYVDFRMFDDRIRLSQYMESVGRIIMRGPNEHVLKKTSGLSGSASKVAVLRLLSEPHSRNQTVENQSSTNVQIQSRFISPVEDGRKSGFVFHAFPRDPLLGDGERRRFSILEGCFLLLLLQVV
eukprot:s1348_g6.t1